MRHIRLMSITAGFALLVSVSGTALPAEAAAECRGRAATIVGSPGEDIVGTAGPDVIVTNGAATVDALGGSDWICGVVTYQVQAGPGNDHVYGSGERVAAGDGNDVVVGAYTDSIEGEAGHDRITSTARIGYLWGGTGDDRIRSAGDWFGTFGEAGDDTMIMVSSANADGGPGRDRLTGTGSIGGLIGGGPGHDIIKTSRHGSGWWIWGDAYGTAGRDGDRIYGRGNPDTAVVYTFASVPLRIDLGRERARGTTADRLVGVRGVVGGAEHPDLFIGDRHANQFLSYAQIADYNWIPWQGGADRVYGRAGNDRILAQGIGSKVWGGRGNDTIAVQGVAHGGPGNDTLLGTGSDDGPMDDTLIGNSGRDTADGRSGTDTCYAETEVSCELPN